MKKFLLYTILAVCLILTAGCKNKNRVITVDDIKSNTVLVKNDGSVQAATIELFDKNYYSLDELNNYITQQINTYNQANEPEAIVLDSLTLKDGNAVLVLNFSSLEHYTAFNEVEAAFTTVDAVKTGGLTMPDVFTSAADGAYASPDVALKNDKYKVLVLHEKTDVIVDGSIKYYTNAVLVSKSKLQTNSEDETVIVYKP